MKHKTSPYDFLERPANMLRGNVTNHVAELLREAIVSLRLEPGTPIDKPMICTQLDISRSPVSEALARLQTEGLVDILPQRGSVVSLIRIDDVQQHMLIRRALESEAISVLTNKYTSDECQEFVATIALQRDAAKADDKIKFHNLDKTFHALFFARSRLNRVRDVVEYSRLNIDRARRLLTSLRRLTQTIKEHELIVERIIAKDAQGAAQAMRQHIDAVTDEFLVFAKNHPQMFEDISNPHLEA